MICKSYFFLLVSSATLVQNRKVLPLPPPSLLQKKKPATKPKKPQPTKKTHSLISSLVLLYCRCLSISFPLLLQGAFGRGDFKRHEQKNWCFTSCRLLDVVHSSFFSLSVGMLAGQCSQSPCKHQLMDVWRKMMVRLKVLASLFSLVPCLVS